MSNEHLEHPTPAQYWKIAVLLAAMTALEVALYYIDRALGLETLNTILLLSLAVLKFIIVVGWYMHLRFEKSLLSRFFTAGFMLACGCYLIVLSGLGVVVIRGN